MSDIKVRHEGGRTVLQWASDTARMLALSASQVMRRLDSSALQLDEDEAPRGKAATPRAGTGAPGGGFNPYDSRGGARKSPPMSRREPHRGAAPTRAPVSQPQPSSGRAKPSWWRRIFQRG